MTCVQDFDHGKTKILLKTSEDFEKCVTSCIETSEDIESLSLDA